MAERPRIWACTDALAWAARDILAQRQLRYPELVDQQKLTAKAAATGIRIASAIAADWTEALELATIHYRDSEFAAAIAAFPDFDRSARATPLERHRMLADALAHPRVAGDRAYAELVEALLWWEGAPDRGDATRAQLNAINAEACARGSSLECLAA